MNTRTVKAVVAPRKTLQIGSVRHQPGDEVEIPEDEVEYLRNAGFIVNPAKSEPSLAAGPDFGPTVRELKDGESAKSGKKSSQPKSGKKTGDTKPEQLASDDDVKSDNDLESDSQE
ncbi:hypothetical protein [Undibacterium sp. SXout20W]|uniref:hypothetical protein n=1 Tax=Undibacterium sp. SXout20W TaxID=3413051 RepID=UPI003BF04410